MCFNEKGFSDRKSGIYFWFWNSQLCDLGQINFFDFFFNIQMLKYICKSKTWAT